MYNQSSYVCAFPGRRDGYQLPLALAESGRLSTFITDIYATPVVKSLAQALPGLWEEKLKKREVAGLPISQVRCLWRTAIKTKLGHSAGFGKRQTHACFDPSYSLAAARHAQRSRSNLLLYEPYAWEAFGTSYTHTPRRVLFQYHPHPVEEERILRQDAERFEEMGFPRVLSSQRERRKSAWKRADLVICASSFTKRSLVKAGADPERCVVIPYGVETAKQMAEGVPVKPGFHALFVGSGVQRKGLHQLLHAWQRAMLPESSTLTLVCRTLDACLEPLVARTDGVHLHRGVSFSKLMELYQSRTLFVMPSLVEGFGQVYLEALDLGCPVLGTANTCLPDIGDEQNGVYTLEPGNTEALTAALSNLSRALPGNTDVREQAQVTADSFTWKRFRRRLTEVL